MEFEGSTGYAVGDSGTVLKTIDGGATWTTFYVHGEPTRFGHLDVIDADSLVFGSGCFLAKFDGSVVSYPASSCDLSLSAISFPTRDIGYLRFGDSKVWKTTDGGDTFTSDLAPVPNADSLGGDLAFAAADIGLATNGDQIFRTTDGGENWAREFDADIPLRGLFVRGSSAVAVGDAGAFLISDDGGDTWTQRSAQATSDESLNFTSVRCSATGVCLMTTGQGGQLVRTADGGQSFQMVDGYGTAVDFASATRAVAVGLGGLTQVSNDAGATFASIGSRIDGYVPPTMPRDARITRIRAASADVAYAAASRGLVLRTVDGGQTWASLGVPSQADVQDVSFVGAESGFALDARGDLFRTTNGGETWRALKPNAAAPPVAVYAHSESVVLLVSPKAMLRSTDGGQRFTRVRGKALRKRTFVNIDPAGSAIVAFGPRAIVASSDGGRSWRTIARPTTKKQVEGLDFRSVRAGWIVQADGRVFSTRNGGRKWTESLAVGHSTVEKVAFATAKTGWLRHSGNPGTSYVLMTSDGGRSWTPQVVAWGEVKALAAAPPNVGFAAYRSSFDVPGLFYTRGTGQHGGETQLSLTTRDPVITKRTKVTIRGRIRPERVAASFPLSRMRREIQVFARDLNGADWQQLNRRKLRQVAPGTFRFKQRLKRSTVFVAQWDGDAFTAGDGSETFVIRRR